MRHITSVSMMALVMGFAVSTSVSAGYAEPPPVELGVLCGKNDNGKGLRKGALTSDGEFEKLLSIMSNRCSNSGGGNGGENPSGYTTYPGIYVGGPSEANDVDPGKSGGHNKAAK